MKMNYEDTHIDSTAVSKETIFSDAFEDYKEFRVNGWRTAVYFRAIINIWDLLAIVDSFVYDILRFIEDCEGFKIMRISSFVQWSV